MSAGRMLAAIVLLTAAPMAGAVTRWAADASASRLEFTATQAGARFDGRFKQFTPQISFDPANLGGSRFVVDVVTGSADTQDKDRDETLAGDDFFATGRWPTAHFETTGFTARSDGQFEARGKLTIRDVTRDVTLPFRFTAQADGRHAVLAGGTTIHRLDYGVGRGEWADTSWVGNDVEIRFELKLAAAP